MKKYISISLALHLSVLAFVFVAEPKIDEKIEIEVEITEGHKGNQKGNNVNVIEITEGPGEKQEVKSFYWGIGVAGIYQYLETGDAYFINDVYSGYAADKAGLLPGDMIKYVNGKSPVVEDISGEGPKELVLTVERNSRVFEIKLERVKVYY